MALNDSQKTSFVFKKAVSAASETSTTRDFFEEPYTGRDVVLPSQVWKDAVNIPNTPSIARSAGNDGTEEAGVIRYYHERTMTAVAGASNAFYLAELIDAIPFNYGDGSSYLYGLKTAAGSTIAFGQNDWIINNAAGTLYFYAGVPSGVSAASPPKISFFKYIGEKGVGGGGGAQGDQGSQGRQGSQGVQGAQGLDGAYAAIGYQGVQGDFGVQGVQGTLGAQGSQGRQGSQGTQGRQGSQGVQGASGSAGVSYIFNTTTTDSDPGIGKISFNSSNTNTATMAFISISDVPGNSTGGWISSWGTSTSDIKGQISLNSGDSLYIYNVTGSVTLDTSLFYYKVPISNVSYTTLSISNNTSFFINFSRSGSIGAQGSEGAQGSQGRQGATGPVGFGAQGVQGTVGAQGSQGLDGAYAAIGYQGVQGASGSQGIQGATGAGFQGVQGTLGAQGTQGFQGATGAGFQGVQGASGSTGTQGIQGTAGVQGSQGRQGASGSTGSQGIQGTAGVQGSQGRQGASGSTGSQGIQGAAGIGFAGPQGVQGAQGSQGSQVTGIPQSFQSASYTLQASDSGKHVLMSSGTVTVPSAVFSIGDAVSIYYNSSSGTLGISPAAGVTMYMAGTTSTGNRTLDPRGLATILNVSYDTFIIFGPGLL